MSVSGLLRDSLAQAHPYLEARPDAWAALGEWRPDGPLHLQAAWADLGLTP